MLMVGRDFSRRFAAAARKARPSQARGPGRPGLVGGGPVFVPARLLTRQAVEFTADFLAGEPGD
jgi:hypothetical protein